MPGESRRVAEPWRGQLGHEPDPGLYVAHLVAICREVRRVLHDTGRLWIELGDTMADGNALGIPWRVAFALQADGDSDIERC